MASIVAGVALGVALFFDPVLSGSRSSACATCHQPGLAWGNGLAKAMGDRLQSTALRSPTLRDVALQAPFTHDGSLPTLASVIDLYDRGGIARPSRSP